jgi:phthiocerol/phenolphthiocerol synthesis type-I polyketide synthase D
MRTTFSRVSAMTPEQRAALTDQFDKASRIATAEPVAVVGIGCRFPGGGIGPQAYWTFLANGGNAVGEVPVDRWDADAFYDPDPFAPGRMSSKWGAFLPDVAGFDADFFGISPREAEAMDPQQRVLLEVAWEAIQNAGFVPERVGGTRAAVMMGVYYSEYQTASAANPDSIDAYSATGNAHSVTVGRIAYLLGLRGPAVAVDTACSSSLVSVHLACQSLRLRESDLALAGGVNLILRPETQLALSKWGMLSPRGRCHAFDAGADGFVRGEGAGVVVLKRLTDAVCDGDRVLAVVRGSAVNQDGRSNGLTAPNAVAQRDVLTRALRGADVAAGSVNYVEAHGTGTALGDPIEFDALADVYGRGDGPCALGAVKTNMGHLEAAAGIAGFIKAVLAIQRGKIPPNLNFKQWNPAIDPSATRLFVPTDLVPWPDCQGPRRAGVSSFGLGGTNAHVVLEQGPDPTPLSATGSCAPAVTTLVISGKTDQRVAACASALADWLEGDGAAVSLADVAHTISRHRSRHGKFAAVCARDRGQAVAGLRAVAAGQPAPGVVSPSDGPRRSGTVFIYSGQGSQWPGMGRELLADEPAFAAAVAGLEPVFVEQVGFSLRQVLETGEPLVGIARIQPVLVGMQLALTELWRSYGVEPDAVIGHSMGEVAAAVVAGALTPADGLRVIATRSRLMSRLSGQGAMALLELTASAAEELIADYPDITLAVYAAPQQLVIAGPPEQVDAVIAVVDAQGRLARRIEVDVASHHPTIDPILPDLRTALSNLAPGTPKTRLISTTGHPGGEPMFDAGYWVANLRNPVRFSQAVAAAGADHSTFIEISPHPLLTHAITESLECSKLRGDVHVGATLNRDNSETLTFHTQLASVHPTLVETAQSNGSAGQLADIPPAPWLHSKYWVADRSVGRGPTGAHPLLGVHVEMPSGRDHVWQADVGTDFIPWLSDHKVHGQPVMPAAAFAEIALAAGSEVLGLPVNVVEAKRLEVDQMLPLDTRTQVTTQLTQGEGNSLRVEIHSRSAAGNWCRHAVARIDAAPCYVPSEQTDSPAEAGTAVSPADFYTALRRTGAQHGQAFAALTRIARTSSGCSETEIALPDEAAPHRSYRIHPVMLDAALQSLAAAMPVESLTGSTEVTYLPVSLETIRLCGAVGRRARCRAELVNVDQAGALGRVTLMDQAGTVTAEITGIFLRRIQRRTVPLPLSQKVFDTIWVQASTASESEISSAPAGSWLVLAEDADAAALAQDFTAHFGSPTRRMVSGDLSDESAVLEAFAKTAADAELPPAGVILFLGHDSLAGSDLDGALLRAREVIWQVSVVARAVVGGWHGKSPRLWLVSRNGLAINGEESGNPAIGALKGLIRVLAYEHPDVRATLIDLDAVGDPLAALTSELAFSGNDDVVAWRGERRYVERLSRATLGARERDPVVRPDSSYVITGGLGGLGTVVARWLVDNGAKRVVLNGRSDPSDEQRSTIAALESRAEIVIVRGDIAAPAVAERLVTAAEETGLPLRGVIHGAAIIDDQIVANLSRESLERVWAPKAAGALRLHETTANRQLDWWVGFSSVASLLGSPGQAAYACANAWLDALVAWRRASGLPATTINWGQWSHVGVARSLALSVLDPITPAEGIDALESLLAGNHARVGVARLRLDRAAAAFPEIHQLGYFATLAEELDAESDDDDWAGPGALRDLDPLEANRIVSARLRRRISAIMGFPDEGAIGTDQPLTGLGMDSLMAVRIRNTVRGDFGVEPPVALMLQGATLTDLAADLIRQLGLAGQESSEAANGVRDRAQQRAAARQRAAMRRKVGQRV